VPNEGSHSALLFVYQATLEDISVLPRDFQEYVRTNQHRFYRRQSLCCAEVYYVAMATSRDRGGGTGETLICSVSRIKAWRSRSRRIISITRSNLASGSGDFLYSMVTFTARSQQTED